MAKIKVDGNTSVYALAGKYIGFSPVPEFFNQVSSFTGYNAVMIPVCTERYDILKTLDALKVISCMGALTDTPHRCELANNAVTLSKEASSCGAVDIVKIDEEGNIYGHNVEIDAFRKAFPKITGEELYGRKVFILGCGGIARAIAVACAVEKCRSLAIASRVPEKAERFCSELNSKFDNIAFAADFNDSETIHCFYNADIIIQATTVGMFPQLDVQPLPDHFDFMPHHIVLDVIYNPPQTKLMQMAERKGCKTYNGRNIMFYTCLEAFHWWTGVKMDAENEKKLFNIWKDLIYNI